MKKIKTSFRDAKYIYKIQQQKKVLKPFQLSVLFQLRDDDSFKFSECGWKPALDILDQGTDLFIQKSENQEA